MLLIENIKLKKYKLASDFASDEASCELNQLPLECTFPVTAMVLEDCLRTLKENSLKCSWESPFLPLMLRSESD